MFDLVYGWPYSTEIFRIKNNVQKSEGNLHYDIEWHPSLPNFLLNNIKTFQNILTNAKWRKMFKLENFRKLKFM